MNKRTKHILEFLENFQQQNNIKIFFCVETGSRGYGTETESSDSDIKGFFIRKPESYLQVKNYTEQFVNHHIFLDKEKEIEIDYTFLDIYYFLQRKITPGNADQMNLWLQSKAVYIDKIPKELKQQLQQVQMLPMSALRGHLKNYIRDFNKQNEIEPKIILNCIVNTTMLLFMKITNSFPIYNVWNLIDNLNKNIFNLQNSQLQIEYLTETGEQKIISYQEIQQLLQDVEKIGNKAQQMKQQKSIQKIIHEREQIIHWLQLVLEISKNHQQNEIQEQKNIGNSLNKQSECSTEQADAIFQQFLQLYNSI